MAAAQSNERNSAGLVRAAALLFSHTTKSERPEGTAEDLLTLGRAPSLPPEERHSTGFGLL